MTNMAHPTRVAGSALTPRLRTLAIEYARLRPHTGTNAGALAYLTWNDLLMATADYIGTRPDYENLLTPRMRAWVEFTDLARYHNEETVR